MDGVGRKSEALLIALGAALYFASSVLAPAIYSNWFHIPRRVKYEELPSVVLEHQIAGIAVLLPVCLALFLAAFASSSSSLRSAIHRPSLRQAIGVLLVVSIMSLVLDFLGVWPFTWRAANNSTPVHVASLLGNEKWWGLGLLLIRSVILLPLIEEVIFRYLILRGVSRLAHSTHAGVLLSSVIFAALHWSGTPDGVLVANSFWILAFSVLLGYATISRQGAITFSVLAHVSRNLVELATLTWAIFSSF